MVSFYIYIILKIFLASIAICLWLYWLWTRREWYKFSWNFPGVWAPPLLGVLVKIRNPNNVLEAFGKMFKDSKRDAICIWLGMQPALLTIDPAHAETVLTSPDMLTKADFVYPGIRRAFNGGLIANPVDIWQRNRKVINPIFNQRVLLSFLPTFNAAKSLIYEEFDIVAGSGEQLISTAIRSLIGKIAIKTMIGYDFDESKSVTTILPHITYITEQIMYDSVFHSVKLRFLFRLNFNYTKVLNYVHNYASELIKEKFDIITKAEAEAASMNLNTNTPNASNNFDQNDDINAVSIKKKPTTYLKQAIKMYQKGKFSWEDLISESYTIITTTYETTSIAVQGVLVLLAMHPTVQERLFEEIVNIFPKKDFDVEYEQLDQLPYLDMVINEALRLMPTIPLVARKVVDNEFKINDKLTLPKDFQVFISIFHLHRRPDIWGPDAHLFNPDNFLPENFAKVPPGGYIPFSRGARNCIGWRYGLIAMKVILSALVRHYRFSTSYKYEKLRFKANVKMFFIEEPPMAVHKRID